MHVQKVFVRINNNNYSHEKAMAINIRDIASCGYKY